MNFKKKENLVLLSQFIEVLLIQAQMGVILWIKQFNSSGFIAVILRVGDALHPGFDDIGPNGGRSKQAIFIPSLGLVGEPEASGLSEHGVIFHFFKCLLPAQTLGGIPVIIIPFVPVDMVSREMLRCLPQIPHLFQLIVMEILEVLLVFLHYSCLREPIEWETNQKKKKKVTYRLCFPGEEHPAFHFRGRRPSNQTYSRAGPPASCNSCFSARRAHKSNGSSSTVFLFPLSRELGYTSDRATPWRCR